jgi:hypothetical protein
MTRFFITSGIPGTRGMVQKLDRQIRAAKRAIKTPGLLARPLAGGTFKTGLLCR